ncbi:MULTISPECIES: hypothetical protein [Salipiger]|uniref:Uncharacterized protein n=1 Tax=Salipiger bermudensis (strain DSM 26914 / JCM 13377 / KCTC 12554 / HTCC2601) TaxID=314265 RepID=Q0FMT9_SALBH|nr:hypothetical protein [Salipiger bermudensis]MAE88417.1 hypothetical protein [Pelagibaca sp.]MBR9894017.1 hypothetical protein [bacterium]EAU45563.1 hypothetical protein R2601_18213 [Salipiger bermudensis HTCC2601]MBN9677070.1 hypothetical protein [Salipiger bermudensis]MCA1286076.1 hypothetical protein [Salipiger bermudensis]
MFAENKLTEDMNDVRDFLINERAKSLTEAEWRFRMRGYGYNLRRVEGGVEVARLPQNSVLGTIEL